jgi:hypothetical protein
MAWIKVDDSFYDNDKMLAAGSIGRDLYWHGMAYANRNLTDGLVPKGRALSLVDFTDAAVITGMGGVDGQDCAPIAVERLLDADLWHEDGHDCPACIQPGPRHFVIHDYLKYQPSRAEVEKKAAETKARVQAWRDKKGGNSVSNSVTADVQTAHKHDNPNPNPNPSSSSLVTKEGEVALRNAREGATPPKCSRHKENSSEPCIKCRDRREWEREQNERQEQDELLARRVAKERADNCPTCHGTNWIPDTDPAVKCHHSEAVKHA